VELSKATHLARRLDLHANAPLTIEGRRRLVDRISSGWTITAAAEAANISRQTASKWWNRWLEAGDDEALADRSSRPRRSPNKTPRKLEKRIVGLRRRRKLGPAHIAGILNMATSTVHAVLVRHGLNRLQWMDRLSGQVIRRIETARCGELAHVDVKFQAVVPPGGGHRMLGRDTRTGSMIKRGRGYVCVHSMIDAHSRLAYTEILGHENAEDCVAFCRRAVAWFATHGIHIERLLSDNGNGYRSHAWRQLCAELGIVHIRTKPRHPYTNGKVERFNRTLRDEWAWARLYRSEAERGRALDRWIHDYNHHRHHTAIGGTPISRVNNLPGHHN
jgi:transposase InsO family protein